MLDQIRRQWQRQNPRICLSSSCMPSLTSRVLSTDWRLARLLNLFGGRARSLGVWIATCKCALPMGPALPRGSGRRGDGARGGPEGRSPSKKGRTPSPVCGHTPVCGWEQRNGYGTCMYVCRPLAAVSRRHSRRPTNRLWTQTAQSGVARFFASGRRMGAGPPLGGAPLPLIGPPPVGRPMEVGFGPMSAGPMWSVGSVVGSRAGKGVSRCPSPWPPSQ